MIPPNVVAMAAKACIIPVALYGMEARWPGLERESRTNPDRLVGTGVLGLTDKLDKALKTAARAVLPVWKTTPIPILHRESGIPSALTALAQAILRCATRLAGPDRNHPQD